MQKDNTSKAKPTFQFEQTSEKRDPQKGKAKPRFGDVCPKCGKGRLDYDGLVNLSCSSCGYALGGCFT